MPRGQSKTVQSVQWIQCCDANMLLTSNCLCLKATGDHTSPNDTDVSGSVGLANLPFETERLEFTYPADEVMRGAEEMHISKEQGGSAAPLTDLIMSDLESTQCCESHPESQLSKLANFVPTQVYTESQSVELMVEKSKEPHKKVIPHMEEESVMKTLEGGSLKGKNTKEMNGAIEGKSYTAGENESVSDFVIKESVLPVVVVNEREYEMNYQNSLLPALGVSQEGDSVALVSESAMEIVFKPEEKSIPALNVRLTENKEDAADSATVNDFKMEDNKSIRSQGRCAEEKGKNCGEEKIEESTEGKHNVNAEKLKDDFSQPKKDDVKRNNNVVPETEASVSTPEMKIPKSPRRSGTEVIETQPRPHKVDKTKRLTKAQAERRMTEKDQPSVQPIIILPDTRETVIKNVAKKRSTPLIPEIKVTLPERVKREEPVIAPRSEILKLEPERVMQPLTQEVAQIFRKKERQTDDASRASGESSSNSAFVIPDLLGVARNTQSSPSVERTQEIKPQNLEARVRGGEEQGSVNTGRGREDDSNIPIIKIACADDNTITLVQEQTHGHPSLPGIIISQDMPQNIPPISVTNAERHTDNKKYDSETLVTVLKIESNQHGPVVTSEKPREQLMSQLLTPNMSTKTLPSITNQDPGTVPQPKDTKVESESDRLQKDKPSVEKLTLTTPVGPTLPPLSPASLRRLIAKNNPNLENQGSISAASVDGSEKKGEESGRSTPTSTLSCESSPKMKRRDSLTLIPSATPEELASGARRKIYLAKTKSEDEGSDTQGKRDSPYMSPSQARRAAFLQLQSGQQTPPTERRSPLMARRKVSLEVPKPKEEMAEVTDSTKTESKPAEKEKLDPFKGNMCIFILVDCCWLQLFQKEPFISIEKIVKPAQEITNTYVNCPIVIDQYW